MIIDPLRKFSPNLAKLLEMILVDHAHEVQDRYQVDNAICNLYESGFTELQYFNISNLYEDYCGLTGRIQKENYYKYDSFTELPLNVINFLNHKNLKWFIYRDYLDRHQYKLWIKEMYNFDYLDLFLDKKGDEESKKICEQRGWPVEELSRAKRLNNLSNFEANELDHSKDIIKNFIYQDVQEWRKINNLSYKTYMSSRIVLYTQTWIAFEDPKDAVCFRMIYY